MNILVAGGAGFIGSHLCTRLTGDGHTVICVDNLITGRLQNIEPLQESEAFTFVDHDICQGLPDIPSIDQIYHLASPASPVAYQKHPIETLQVNSIGTQYLLDRALEENARMLFASTSEIYGDPLEHPQRESYWGNVNTVGPRSMYDEAKRFGETLVTTHQAEFGTQVRLARVFNTYGPKMDVEDGRVVSNFIVQALTGKAITVYGDGSHTRSFQYVDDLVEGLVRLMNSSYSGPVNLGNPDEFTILELAQLVIEATDSPSAIDFEPIPEDDPKVRQPEIALARDLLDWEPRINLRDGLQKSIPYFAERIAASL